jgi:hypothetical protein
VTTMNPLAAFDPKTMEMALKVMEWERERALMDWKLAEWRIAMAHRLLLSDNLLNVTKREQPAR